MVMRAFARSIRPCSRTSGRTVRDREDEGSNPGPPTKVSLFEPYWDAFDSHLTSLRAVAA